MSDGLLFVYAEPGPVAEADFHDWYDTEHGPARMTVPGIRNGYRFAALDGRAPSWLATYDLRPGALDSPEYKAIVANASDREKTIMSSLGVLDRRVYELISDTGPATDPPAAVLAVAMSVSPDGETDLDAWYTDEHIPMLMGVPGWRRIRRFRRTDGPGPDFLSLHEIDGTSVFEDDGYRAATATPWRNRIVASATERDRRVFGFRNAFLDLPDGIDYRPASAGLPRGGDQDRQARLHRRGWPPARGAGVVRGRGRHARLQHRQGHREGPGAGAGPADVALRGPGGGAVRVRPGARRGGAVRGPRGTAAHRDRHRHSLHGGRAWRGIR